ncbi:PilW family protein [Fontimonas sp. SYSU GA230001]|uniref:PilW family protein n=1 Tax=Fontimonas sp. SYSU GA230001 TaxID=3142450 RepID=UPI0032B33196
MPAAVVTPLLRLNRHRSTGLTLIELMIAITVALVLLAALAAMYGSSIKARNQIERINRQTENGRYAIQLLRDDIQLAGFFGEYNMRDRSPGVPAALPDVCVTHLTTTLPADNVATADLNGDTAINGLDYLTAVMALQVQGFDDVDPSSLPVCLSGADVRAGTDIIVVRRVLTCRAGIDPNCGFTANAPYLQASQCNDQINQMVAAGQMPMRLRANANTTAFNLMDINCVSGTVTPIRRYVTHIYFVANNNLANDGVPTLKRRELTSTGFTTTALVEGIEDLQFEYGIDNTGTGGNPDGTPDVYLDDPADDTVSPSVQAAWANVTAVRTHLLSRSTEERRDYVDANSYTLGTKTIAAPGDHHTRQVFQTVVQLHNITGRRQ